MKTITPFSREKYYPGITKELWLFVFLVTCVSAFAQNLAPNPGFEDFHHCPTTIGSTAAYYWSNPTAGDPQYFNACRVDPDNNDVPFNYYGSQIPMSGEAYAGIIAYDHSGADRRDYVQLELLEPIEAGVTYQVGFYVSLSDNSGFAVNQMGAYLSSSAPGSGTNQTLNVTPQITNTNGMLTDQSHWIFISGLYTATGNETSLTIGNFANDAMTDKEGVHRAIPIEEPVAFYYVDDVSITPVGCTIAYAGPDITICNGGNVTLGGNTGCSPAGVTYLWMPGGATSSTFTTLEINNTTTYTLTVNNSGIITTDEVTVYVQHTSIEMPYESYVYFTSCPSAGVRLDPQVTGSVGTVSYNWTPHTGLSSTLFPTEPWKDPDPKFLPPTNTNYTFTVTSGVCTLQRHALIRVWNEDSLPVIGANLINWKCLDSPDNNYTYMALYQAGAVPNFPDSYYKWRFEDQPDIVYTGFSIIRNATQPGTYKVTLTIDNGFCPFLPKTSRRYSPPKTSSYNTSCCSWNVNPTEPVGDERLSVFFGRSVNAYGNLVVYSGDSVYIDNHNFQMGPGTKIIVQPGAVLYLRNVTVQGGVCGTMWDGIEVWGQGHLSHSSGHIALQGKLYLENSRINDAHIGILAGNSDSNMHYGYGGGYINAVNTHFNRNGISVKFTQYQTEPNNKSVFKNCRFNGGLCKDPGYKSSSTAYQYPNPNNPFYAKANALGRSSIGMDLNRVNYVDLWGCQFKNYEIAIRAIDAPFNINNSNPTGLACTFDSVKYGIVLQHINTGLNYPHEIYDCFFKRSDSASIFIDGGRYKYIGHNHFGEGINDPKTRQADNPKGIMLRNTSFFEIHQNDFFKMDTAILIDGSEEEGGRINTYHPTVGNIFKLCKIGIRAINYNPNLQIRCAVHDNNSIAGDNDATIQYECNWKIGGYLEFADQGGNAHHRSPAGNTFMPESKKHICSDLEFIYYHHKWGLQGSSDLSVIPTGQGPIDTQITSFEKQVGSCIPSVPCTPSCDIALEDNDAQQEALQAEYNDLVAALDNADTQTLLDLVNDTGYDNDQLRDDLMNGGLLSDMVLLALINRLAEQGYPSGSFLDIMTLNLPCSEVVWSQVQGILPGISPEDADAIIALQANNDTRTLTRIERDYILLLNERQQILQEYLQNNLDPNDLVNSIQNLWNSLPLDNKETAVASLISSYNPELAASYLLQLENEPEVEQDWIDIAQLQIDLQEQNRSLYELSPQELAMVRTISRRTPVNRGVSNAQAILSYVYGETFPTGEHLNSGTEYRRRTPERKKLFQEDQLLNVYPNPARDLLNVACFVKVEGTTKMVLRDLLGKEIYSQVLPKGFTVQQIDVSGISSGIYILNVEGNRRLTAKVIIQK